MLFEDLDLATSWGAVIGAEPGLTPPLSEDALDNALEAIADCVKSIPFTLGRSRGVSRTGDAAPPPRWSWAAPQPPMSAAPGYLWHDLGRLGVSNAVLGQDR